ncbi:MAG: DUF2703 domain-containing protein, partial [Nitrospiraceae bacterium]
QEPLKTAEAGTTFQPLINYEQGLTDTMKTLTIRWHRLVDESGRTCDRCRDTGNTVKSACSKLQKALAARSVQVRLETEAISVRAFKRDPLQSNRLLIGGRPLEEWVGAAVGQSQCCHVCGDSQCRTLTIGSTTFEAIPEELIVKAGLLAAAELFGDEKQKKARER